MSDLLGIDGLDRLDLTELRPFFSITVLECQVDDFDRAYLKLIEHFDAAARKKGRAVSVEVLASTQWTGEPSDERSLTEPTTTNDTEAEFLRDRGFDRLYAIVRRRDLLPPWAKEGSRLIDSTNELTLALRRSRLVAIRSDIEDATQLLRWADKPTTPYKPLLPEILHGTFNGDGRMAWLQGVHRQKTSKPNSKALGGSRLQDAYDAGEDFTYALTAMRVDYVPEDLNASLRGVLTVSPDKSHLSSKAMQSFADFVISTDEALSLLEKAIAGNAPPEPVMPGYASREKDARRISGAYDVRIASPEEIESSSRDVESDHNRAELLRSSVLEVQGERGSADATIGVGLNGSTRGQLLLRPVQSRGGYQLNVRVKGTPTDEGPVRQVRDAVEESDLVSVYYESGHTYTSGQVSKQNLSAPPFANMQFQDFSGFDVSREKPRAAEAVHLHDRIAIESDRSIFAWVVANYTDGLLICDDGAGEIADFLYLANDGSLTAIHVKAAHSSSPRRRVAVTSFEELVSQAEKNIKRLETDVLQLELAASRMPRPACWSYGHRVDSRSAFVEQLGYRSRSDKTYVVLVQPLNRPGCGGGS